MTQANLTLVKLIHRLVFKIKITIGLKACKWYVLYDFYPYLFVTTEDLSDIGLRVKYYFVDNKLKN